MDFKQNKRENKNIYFIYFWRSMGNKQKKEKISKIKVKIFIISKSRKYNYMKLVN